MNNRDVEWEKRVLTDSLSVRKWIVAQKMVTDRQSQSPKKGSAGKTGMSSLKRVLVL